MILNVSVSTHDLASGLISLLTLASRERYFVLLSTKSRTQEPCWYLAIFVYYDICIFSMAICKHYYKMTITCLFCLFSMYIIYPFIYSTYLVCFVL